MPGGVVANRSAYTVGEIEPNAGLMAPFRGRRTADVAVQTNAFGVFETGHARIEPVRIQPGANERERQTTSATDLTVITGLNVDARSGELTNVLRKVFHITVRRAP